MASVDVFSRRGCHLCEVLIEELLALVGASVPVAVHDVDTRSDWQDAYGHRVPVVVVREQVICEHRLDSDALRRALADGA